MKLLFRSRVATRGLRRLIAGLVFPALVATSLIFVLFCAPRSALGQAIPNTTYQNTFRFFFAGDFDDAREGFEQAARNGLRRGDALWADSICYRTMLGETHLRMGDLKRALDYYDSAVMLFLQNPKWMSRVEFPPALSAFRGTIRPPVKWTGSGRAITLPDLTGNFAVRFGGDVQRVIRQGGIVDPPTQRIVNVPEIVRCTVLAIRRRAELMGVLMEDDALNDRLVTTYQDRLGVPNHWSIAWLNVQKGVALAAAGKDEQAIKSLRAALALGGRYDHALTGEALFALGQIQRKRQLPAEAIKLFLDASAVAATFEQASLAEEALYAAAEMQAGVGDGKPLPQLGLAANWARAANVDHMQATTMVAAADLLAAAGDTRGAGELLKRSRQALDRRAALSSQFAAKAEFVRALVLFSQNKLDAGKQAFDTCMAAQRSISPWLFQIALTDQLYQTRRQAMTARRANLLFNELLRDPTPRDWQQNIIESLCVSLTPHELPLEHWFEIALERNETERSIEIADLIRRHRFYSELPLGGRMLSLRWLLAAPTSQLPNDAIILRDDLLTRYPEYKTLADEARKLRDQLRGIPIRPTDEAQLKQYKSLSRDLDLISNRQEAMIGQIALRRENCPFLFPPIRSTNEIQEGLRPGELALVFLKTSKATHGFMLSRENYAEWDLPTKPSKLRKQLGSLITSIGGDGRSLSIDQLESDKWQEAGSSLLRGLIQRAQLGFWDKFDELIIVPDGELWYLPFEALTVGADEAQDQLVSKVRVRYAPTAGLISNIDGDRGRHRRTAVVSGKLAMRQTMEQAQDQLEALQEVDSDLEAVPSRLPTASGLLRSVWDRLVVLDANSLNQSRPFDWSPASIDDGRPGSLLQRWMRLPWGNPDQVLLPGTNATASSRGRDMFLTSMGLMANGSRTVLLSRWQTGGQTSYDLVREYLQEEPHSSPVRAWHRAVQVIRSSEIDPVWEPRIKSSAKDTSVAGKHPFLWSGFLLIDSVGDYSVEEPAEDDQPAADEEAPASLSLRW